MTLAVVYRRQVGRDLAAAFDHYEAQSRGLGEKFLAAATSGFEAMALSANVRRGAWRARSQALAAAAPRRLNHDRGIAMLDWSACPVVERNPAKSGGAWVFRGTRVPFRALFENLQDGATTEEFLQWFPGVTSAQVDAVLQYAARD